MTLYREAEPWSDGAIATWVVPVEPLDTTDAERVGIDHPGFELCDIWLPNERRDRFRVAVFDAGIKETP